MQKTEFH